MSRYWLGIWGVLIIVFGIVAVGCDDTPSPRQDLPDNHVTVDTGTRVVYVNSDQFPNVEAWCDGTTRLYVTTRDSQNPIAVPDHPLCGPG